MDGKQDSIHLPRLHDPTQQIRLLAVLPSDDNETIQCALSVHTLEDAEYVAISYTWGDVNDKLELELDGQPVHVPRNCWYALWQFRRHGVLRYCWIDCLCIDQSSSREKSIQVARMDVIYSNAQRIAACIGERGRDQALFDAVDADEPYSVAHSSAIKAFADRPYFQRQWTVQEFILAQHIDVFVGASHYLWATLMGFAHRRQERRLTDLYNIHEDVSMYIGFEGPRRPLDISRTVLRYKHRSCSNPRDIIYSIVALAYYTIQERIALDYNKSLWTVLLDYTTAYRILRHPPSGIDYNSNLHGIRFVNRNVIGRSFDRYSFEPFRHLLADDRNALKEPEGLFGRMRDSIRHLCSKFAVDEKFCESLATCFNNPETAISNDGLKDFSDPYLDPAGHSPYVLVQVNTGHFYEINTEKGTTMHNLADAACHRWYQSIVTGGPGCELPCHHESTLSQAHDYDDNIDCIRDGIRQQGHENLKLVCIPQPNRFGRLKHVHFLVPHEATHGDIIVSFRTDSDPDTHILCRSSVLDSTRHPILGLAIALDDISANQVMRKDLEIVLTPRYLLAISLLGLEVGNTAGPLVLGIDGSWVNLDPGPGNNIASGGVSWYGNVVPVPESVFGG